MTQNSNDRSRPCWMCLSQPADTREHKFKASDLRRFFGDRWTPVTAPVHGRESQQLRPQGPGSATMTFGYVLCAKCNNQVSQPFDKAYDSFVAWVLSHKDELVQTRIIDFERVYGEGWELHQLNLFRYFAKHLGCSIFAACGPEVPSDLPKLMYTSPFQTALRVTFQIHEDILIAPGLDEGLFIGPLGYLPSDESGIPTFWSDLVVAWLRIGLWYYVDPAQDDERATPWTANAKVLQVGSHAPLTPELRAELRERAKGYSALPCSPSRKTLLGSGIPLVDGGRNGSRRALRRSCRAA